MAENFPASAEDPAPSKSAAVKCAIIRKKFGYVNFNQIKKK